MLYDKNIIKAAKQTPLNFSRQNWVNLGIRKTYKCHSLDKLQITCISSISKPILYQHQHNRRLVFGVALLIPIIDISTSYHFLLEYYLTFQKDT